MRRSVLTIAAALMTLGQAQLIDAAKKAITNACCAAPQLVSSACSCPRNVLGDPTVKQLTQEPYRCGCPPPSPSVKNCRGSITNPVSSTCGCQPRSCNPPPMPTKVLTVQCYDITTYRSENTTQLEKKIVIDQQQKTKREKKAITSYVKVPAIRYRIEMTESNETRKQWIKQPVTRQFPKVVEIKVPAPPAFDCCGKMIAEPDMPCSCDTQGKFITKYINKFENRTVMEDVEVDEIYTVEKPKQVAYKVFVNKPVITYVMQNVNWIDTVPRETWVNVTTNHAVPIVTRVCKDGKGNPVRSVDEVPLHHSGPTYEQLRKAGPITSFTEAYSKPAKLVNAPLDIHDGKGYLQVGEVSTGAGPPNFGPDGTDMGVGFEYPPVQRDEVDVLSPKECFRSIFSAPGEGCQAKPDPITTFVKAVVKVAKKNLDDGNDGSSSDDEKLDDF